jgi:hypothetical protein
LQQARVPSGTNQFSLVVVVGVVVSLVGARCGLFRVIPEPERSTVDCRSAVGSSDGTICPDGRRRFVHAAHAPSVLCFSPSGSSTTMARIAEAMAGAPGRAIVVVIIY